MGINTNTEENTVRQMLENFVLEETTNLSMNFCSEDF